MNYDRGFAYAMGVVFLFIGVCAVIPGFLSPAMQGPSDPAIASPVLNVLHGDLMHAFHFNIVLSLIYIGVGGLGFVFGSAPRSANRYAKLVAIGFGLLALLGFEPTTSTLLGLAPIGGQDVGLHLIIAVIAGTFGFVIRPSDWTTVATLETPGQLLEVMPTHD